MWMQQWMPAAAADCPQFYSHKNPQHTACKPLNTWCKIKESGMDDTQRGLILKLHNHYRSRIARGNVTGFKPAADMQELLWDSDLEYVAQAHANLCTTPDGDLKHDHVRDRFTPRFEFTGQNLAWIGRSFSDGGPNWTYVILNWFEEHKLYPARLVSRFDVTAGIKTGHFTQLVWAKSRYVGCGYVYYTVDKARYPHMKHYAC
ncbi:CRISP/Allergen/PR-1-like [Dermacentor silvarum]|uniref:CRISP/Allergen/PR-1-like n=1 Tax=Dermacentor silvarum TaxID=543639 RepID=UPI002100AE6C|nr:CRISP/Allergen/PR-1-like [Dermacentor silvarum]